MSEDRKIACPGCKRLYPVDAEGIPSDCRPLACAPREYRWTMLFVCRDCGSIVVVQVDGPDSQRITYVPFTS